MSQWGTGTVIMNRYRLDSMLGQGGMGSVWKAEHLQLKSPVAIKMLDPAIATDQQMLARFLREAQACAALRSPHVVQIFDYGVDEGTAFIAMEMLNGESLSDRIARLGRLPVEEVVRFISEVLRAIAKAHEAGIVHRDLKPDNIFICREEPEFAKVLDFGVAKITNKDLGTSGGKTQTGMMIGTPYYMSPEQTQAKDVDHRADLWGIAIIAYECLTGQRPFMGESFGELVIAICTAPTPLPSKLAPVPQGFDEWFVRGTQRDKSRRFQSAREMADELARLVGGTSVGPRPTMTSAATANVAVLPDRRVNSPVPALSAATPPARVDEMQLTTGQRAVVSSGSPSTRAPTSPVVYALAGLAALIVIGVGVFVAAGGAAAFRQPEPEDSTAAALTPPELAPPPVEPPIDQLPPPAAVPEPSSAPAASAAPAASSAAPTAAPLPAEKSAPQPANAPAKSAKPKVGPAPKGKDPLPPKNWEF